MPVVKVRMRSVVLYDLILTGFNEQLSGLRTFYSIKPMKAILRRFVRVRLLNVL